MSQAVLRAKTSKIALGTALGAALMASSALAVVPGSQLVTSPANDGPGTLRAALRAVAETGGSVFIVVDGDITISETLEYPGTLPVAIHGNGQTIQTSENVTLLYVKEGADLTVSDLSFTGPGGFSIENRGDVHSAAGKGIFVKARENQSGMITLTLSDVVVSSVAAHGIHVSDCSLADECGGGSGGGGDGSDASISVNLNNVRIANVGYGRFDADGLRVDERGPGDIHMVSHSSSFTGVGADGVELDEGNDGSVIAQINGDRYVDNGGYCDPDIMSSFMPDTAEAEFDEGTTQESAIPGPVSGSPDDRCIERVVDFYDDGSVEAYEFAIDLDDGIDLDEAGAGGIDVVMTGAVIRDNLDEGVDFDEEDDGDIKASFIRSTAEGNKDDGFKNSEEGDGDVIGLLHGSTAKDNGGKGIVYEEADAGTLTVHVEDSNTSNNDDGDDTGIEVVQEDDDTPGTLTVVNSDIADGIDADGVTVTQDGK